MKKLLLLTAIIIAAGEKSYSETHAARLEDTVITDSNFETNILEVPKNVTVITSNEIEERGAQTLAEVLKVVPSLTVTTIGGGDAIFDLRGQGDTAKSNVLILLDGVPLNSIDLSGYKTSMIDVSSIERIEIIPSGGSVLYGDGAVGGVINIITKSPQDRKNYGSITLEGGSYDFGKLHGTYGTSVGENLLLMGGYTKKNLNGYRDGAEDNLDDFSITGKYLLEEGAISLSANHSKNSFKAPAPLLEDEWKDNPKQMGGNILDGSNEENLYTLNFNKKLSSNLEFFIYGSYTEQEYRSLRKYGATPSWNYRRDYDTKNFYLKPQFKYSYLDNSHLIVGGDFQKASTDIVGTGKSKKESLGGFIFNKYVHNSWEFTQGYRRQSIKYNYFENINYQSISKSKSFEEDALDLSVNYLLSDSSSIYLSYSTAFRTPNTDEIGFWDFSTGVDPQTSQTVELGTKTSLGNTFITAAVFTTLTKNEIFFDDLALTSPEAWPGANSNLQGENRRVGAEIFMEHYLDKVVLRESFSYMNTEIKDGIYKGKELPSVPSYLANIGVTYRPWEKLALNGDLNYVGKSYAGADFMNIGGKVPSYATMDINVRYSFSEEFSIYGGINNLFDKKYSDYIVWSGTSGKNYYPSNGRNFYLGTTYKF